MALLDILLPAVFLLSTPLATNAGKHTCPHPTPPYPDPFYWMCDLIYSRDANKDNIVTETEYLNSVVISNMIPEQAKAFFLVDDLNGDGVIDSNDDSIYFRRMDVNKDGKIYFREYNWFEEKSFRDVPFMILYERLRKRFNVTSLDKSQYQKLFSSLHTTDTGSITRANFRKAWSYPLSGLWRQFDKVFKNLDLNNDNLISEEELEQQFSTVDENNNGQIEYNEVYIIDGPL